MGRGHLKGMDTVLSTSSWVPGIGILAGKRNYLEVTSFLSRMFCGNMVAQAYEGADDGGGWDTTV